MNYKFKGVVYRYILKAEGPEHGWSYVGETMEPVQRQLNWSKPSTQYYAGGKIGEARKKYGTSSNVWDYEKLEEFEDDDKKSLKERLEKSETYYIAKFNSFEKGFNANKGGTGNFGVNFSPEWRAKIGAASKGRNHTYETKQKISAKLKGRKVPEEIRKKISAANKGKKRTPEQIKAMSERMKGKVMSPEARAKSSATKKGKPHHISAEGMANINAHRFRIRIKATDRDGKELQFNSLSEAARYYNQSVAAISHLLKTGNYGTHGYKFIKLLKK